jgi:hypothetical protein
MFDHDVASDVQARNNRRNFDVGKALSQANAQQGTDEAFSSFSNEGNMFGRGSDMPSGAASIGGASFASVNAVGGDKSTKSGDASSYHATIQLLEKQLMSQRKSTIKHRCGIFQIAPLNEMPYHKNDYLGKVFKGPTDVGEHGRPIHFNMLLLLNDVGLRTAMTRAMTFASLSARRSGRSNSKPFGQDSSATVTTSTIFDRCPCLASGWLKAANQARPSPSPWTIASLSKLSQGSK